MTAIVGPSGAGKTTILRLIARFWDADSGDVSIGGEDVRQMSTEVLIRQISVVIQDVYLFDGTIDDNIRIGRPEATGARLGGGERQRVSIARAILKDAPIVLLDEATAALDPINERAVQQALQALAQNKTLVVVAYRLQTVQAAEQNLVLDQGRIVGRGKHSTLLEQEGRYASFWRERVRAAGWRVGKQEPKQTINNIVADYVENT